MVTAIGFDSWPFQTALKVLSPLPVCSTEVTTQSLFDPFGQLSPTSGTSPLSVVVTSVSKKPVNCFGLLRGSALTVASILDVFVWVASCVSVHMNGRPGPVFSTQSSPPVLEGLSLVH